MNNITFYTRYAIRSLTRGGQHTFLAILCIAFGVMSLVAMQSLSTLFTTTLIHNATSDLGGDLSLDLHGKTFTADNMAQLEQLKTSGALRSYTLATGDGMALLKPNGTGHAYMLNRQGIDPDTFPLVGKFEFQDTTASVATLLATPNSSVLTRDVANALQLKVGDSFSLIDLSNGPPATLHITGIAAQTPTSNGSTVYYSLNTARAISGGQEVVAQANAMLGTSGDAVSQLNAAGWFVQVATSPVGSDAAATANLFDFMFKCAGILGLIIGGIGVANTLQVMLARRKLEIAVLKTLGYQQRDLLALFGIETGLMGLAGCALGAGGAVLLSYLLVGQFTRTLSLLVNWSIDPLVLIGGVLAGFATTLVFGTYVIVRASNIRPAVLLRNLPQLRTWSALAGTAAMIGLLVIVYGGICTLIMGSISAGFSVIVGAIVGFIVLGLLFSIVLFVLIRVPAPRFGLLNMARNNLKRQQLRAVYALIALFAGVFTIGFAAMVISNASDRFTAHGIATSGNNLAVYAHVSDVAQINDQLGKQGLAATQIRYETLAQAQGVFPVTLQGRDRAPDDLTLKGAAWGSQPDGAYIPAEFSKLAAIGDSLKLTAANGTTGEVKIVGTYTTTALDLLSLRSQAGRLVVSKDTALALGGPTTTVIVISAVATDQLQAATDSLGKALPNLTVMSLADIDDAIQRTIRNLFTLAVAIAGLALVAGAVLIANSVGLAMVERRREIGILKAIGYGSGRVLGVVMLEQGLLGLLGGLMGMGAVWIAIQVLDRLQSKAQMVFNSPQAAVMIGVAIVIALTSAALVAIQPARVRPLVVLRDE